MYYKQVQSVQTKNSGLIYVFCSFVVLQQEQLLAINDRASVQKKYMCLAYSNLNGIVPRKNSMETERLPNPQSERVVPPGQGSSGTLGKITAI